VGVRIAIFIEDTSNFIEQRELCSADHDTSSNERDENLPMILLMISISSIQGNSTVGRMSGIVAHEREKIGIPPISVRAELGHVAT
jgi:hypothetical protein